MVITQRIYVLIGAPLIFLAALSLFGTLLIWQNYNETQMLFSEIVGKQNLLSSIYYEAGYGGGIHHFKNLVLRRDLRYLNPAKKSLSQAIDFCNQYLYQDNISPIERASIDQLKSVFSGYLKNADIAQIMISNKKSIEEIDRMVKIDDTHAIAQSLKIRELLQLKQKTYLSQFQKKQFNIFILLGVLFVSIIALSAILTNVANVRIKKVIDNAVNMAREVASGNYAPAIDDNFINDFGSLFKDILLMAQNIQKKINQLEVSNNDLKQFAFIAAHDLQEPLNKIIAYADLILLEEADNISSTTEEEIQKIIKSSQRLRNLVHDLLIYADLASYSRPADSADLSQALKSAINHLQDSIDSSQTIIDSIGLPVISGSEKHFEILFENLISNSIKFRSPDKQCHIQILCTKDAQNYKIIFKDNGIGFEQKYSDQVTKPFVRIHDKNLYPGSGVGLAICLRILKIYDSDFSITSSVGKGAQFSFTLSEKAPPL